MEEVIVKLVEIGFLFVVCFLYVLGGCVMEVVYDEDDLCCYMIEVVLVLNEVLVLFDYFLDNVIEVDVDVICDGE